MNKRLYIGACFLCKNSKNISSTASGPTPLEPRGGVMNTTAK